MNNSKIDSLNPRALRRQFAGYAAHLAVVRNDAAGLAAAVEALGVNCAHHDGHTPLTLAIVLERADLVAQLIDAGADVRQPRAIDERDAAPVHLAARCADDRILARILAASVDMHVTDSMYRSPFHVAAQNPNARALALVLDAAALAPNVTAQTTVDHDTIAHVAAGNENESVIQLLIARGLVDVCARNDRKLTPLHCAAANRNERVLAALLALADADSRVDVAADDGARLTLLHVAAQNENAAVLALVLARPGAAAELDVSTRDGSTPCSFAVRNSNDQILAMLLAAGADVHAPIRNRQWLSLCHGAANNKNDAVMSRLLAAGASFGKADAHGVYPVHVAARLENERVLAALLAAGAEHFVTSSAGETLCMEAARNTNAAVMRLLVSVPGVDLDARNSSGLTACQIAARANNLRALEVLIGAGCDWRVLGEHAALRALAATDAVFNALVVEVCGPLPPALVTDATAALCDLGPSEWIDAAAVRACIRRGASVHAVDRLGRTPCHFAPDVALPELIAVGANVNALAPALGVTPCEQAVGADNDRLLSLIAAGSDVSRCKSWADKHATSMNRLWRIALAMLLAASDGDEREVLHVTESMVGWAAANIALRQFDLLRLRGAQVCIGLRSLDLPALLACEILAHVFAPRECVVPFHKVWAIAAAVKHFRRESKRCNNRD
jgi:ankyrin repeat protein